MSPGQPTSEPPPARKPRRFPVSLALITLAVLALTGLLTALVFFGNGSGSGVSGTGPALSVTTLGTSTVRITSSEVTTTRAVTTPPVSTHEVTTVAIPTVAVPFVLGLQQAAAAARIQSLGLRTQSRTQTSVRPVGLVLSQNPGGGVKLTRGALVGLTVSAGPGTGIVPSVLGLTAAEAAASLRKAGLGAKMHPVASNSQAGLVVAQSPAGGTHALHGTALLSVSKGPPHLRIPNVTGTTRSTAVGRLHLLGLVARVHIVPSQKPAGNVVGQIPRAGASAVRGSIVNLSVAQGNGQQPPPARVTVPDVVRLQQPTAARKLRSVGLKPRVLRVHSLFAVGSVVAQSPAGGSQTARGTQVSISISTGPGP